MVYGNMVSPTTGTPQSSKSELKVGVAVAMHPKQDRKRTVDLHELWYSEVLAL